MPVFAQTNLQLYKQLLDLGYEESSVQRVGDAYTYCLQLFSGWYRGNGKPFLNHLVGTASIVAAEGLAEELVIAALLHAAYSHGSLSFLPLRWGSYRRRKLATAIGTELESIVWAYHCFRLDQENLIKLSVRAESLTKLERQLITLRLANDLEDHLDDGLVLCGKRKALYQQAANLRMLETLAAAVGHTALLDQIRELAAVSHKAVPPGLISARADSYLVPSNPWQRLHGALLALKRRHE
jgi:hypothetical protein